MFEELNNDELMEFDGGGFTKFLLGTAGAIGCFAGTMVCSIYGLIARDYTASEYCSEAYTACVNWALSDGYYIW